MGWIALISSSLFVCMVAFAATSSSRFGREPKNRPEIPSWFLMSSTPKNATSQNILLKTPSVSCELPLGGTIKSETINNERKLFSNEETNRCSDKGTWRSRQRLDELARKFSRLFRGASTIRDTTLNILRGWQGLFWTLAIQLAKNSS